MESTARLGLKKLLEDGADKVSAIREAINANATALDDALPLLLVAHSANVEAKAGELVKATGAITVTSPAAADNAVFGVLANGHAVTVKAAAGDIYGDFEEGVTEVKLVGYQHVILQSDGTSWFIIAGEPKRENLNTAKAVIAEATPSKASAARPAFATVSFNAGEGEGLEIKVGGVAIGSTGSVGVKGTGVYAISFLLNPGEEWEWVKSGFSEKPGGVQVSYKLM